MHTLVLFALWGEIGRWCPFSYYLRVKNYDDWSLVKQIPSVSCVWLSLFIGCNSKKILFGGHYNDNNEKHTDNRHGSKHNL